MSFKNYLTIIILVFTAGVSSAAPEIRRDIMKDLARKPRIAPDPGKNRYGKALAGVALVKLKSGVDFTQILIAPPAPEYKITGYETLLPADSRASNLNSIVAQKKYPNPAKLAAVLRAEEPLSRTYVVAYDGALDPAEFSKLILKDLYRYVEYAEPYYVYDRLGTPNDPLIDRQKMLGTIKAFNAWDIAPGSPNVVIGISDSGVDQDHEDIASSLAVNAAETPNDNQDNDDNGYVDDYSGYNFCWEEDGKNPNMTRSESDDHGMLVAGIAAATQNNGKGIAGVAGACRIFPLKVVPDDETDIVYGYQSIIYAASRGFKVLNCSWGSPKEFSLLDQEIIDYALANDLAIVAASGNVSSNGATKYSTFFPAGYYGVLGVGEVNQNDVVVSGTTISAPARIMAPGGGNWGTAPEGMYEATTPGTSFAAPVVSGALAVVRSKFPDLSALQAMELLRQTGDDISFINQGDPDSALIPKRVNLLNAVTANPFSKPAILPFAFRYYDEAGVKTDRFDVDQTAKLEIDVRNFLGSAGNLTCKLSVAYDPANSIKILQETAELPPLQTNEAGAISSFVFKIIRRYEAPIIFRVDITGDDGYHDFFKFDFIPTKDYSTFENEALVFSLSDVGEFGFSALGLSAHGSGFTLKGHGNAIYETSGLMASANDAKVVATLNEDFFSIKPFLPPNRNIGIVDDTRANEENFIGLRISQEVFLPSGDTSYTKIRLKVKNMSGTTLNNPAVGYFMDWDIGVDTDSNRISLNNGMIPAEKQGVNSAVMIAESTIPGEAFYAVGVYSGENDARAQAAALTYSYIETFENQEMIAALNSGTTMQHDGVDDMSMVAGMRFNGEFPDEAERVCEVCVAAAETREELTALMRNCMNKALSAREEISILKMKAFPQPARSSVTFELPSEAAPGGEIRIYDAFGALALKGVASTQAVRVDLSGLAQGAYYVVYSSGSITAQTAFTVIK